MDSQKPFLTDPNVALIQPQEETSINLQKVIGKFLAYWPWFVACLILSLAIAFIYLRYSTPIYRVSAKIMVQDDKKGAGLPDANVLEGLGISGGKSNVDNELEIMKSRTLMERVVGGLQLNVTYFSAGRIKETEIYSERPFDVQFVSFFEDSLQQPVRFQLRQEGAAGFVLEGDSKTWKGSFGDTLRLPVGIAVITKRYVPNEVNQKIAVVVAGLEPTV